MLDPIDEFLMEKEGAAPVQMARQMLQSTVPEVGKGSALRHLGRGLAWGAGVAGTALMGQAALEAYEAAKGAIQKSRGFNSMLEQNPTLRKMDRQKVQSIYSTLHRFNPEMAQDPFVAGSMVKKINEYDYVDPRTIGELVSARNRMGSGPLFDPVGLATGMANVAMGSYESEKRQEHDWRRMQAEQEFKGQQMGAEQSFRTGEREAGEEFRQQQDDLAHQRHMRDRYRSDQFAWRREQEKFHREDERMREKAWLERQVYAKKGDRPFADPPDNPLPTEMSGPYPHAQGRPIEHSAFGGPAPFPRR